MRSNRYGIVFSCEWGTKLVTLGVDFDGTGKKDIFQDFARRVLKRMGYQVVKFTDSRIYHNARGSIHCGTNAIRLIPADTWWTTSIA